MSPIDSSDSASPRPGPSGPAAPQTASSGRASDPAAPTALDGLERLQLLETLTYGNVYESRLFQASRPEATTLLELSPALTEDPDRRSAAFRELLAACRLTGSNILSPRGLYREGDTVYALFDASAGLSLATAFEYLERAGLRLAPEAVLRLASGVLHALDQISGRDAGLPDEARCHGVLVPENIRIGEAHRILVRGFGLDRAGILRTSLLTVRERRFLAPGRNDGSAATPSHDLFSLGAMLFEAVAGCPAFDAPPTEGDVDDLCARIEEIRSTSDPLRRELFAVVLACLAAAAATPTSLARLRVLVDTLFLREAARERVSGTLSLEELVSRVKSPRPAIVKARPLSLHAVVPFEPPARPDPRRPEPVPSIDEESSAIAPEKPLSSSAGAFAPPARRFPSRAILLAGAAALILAVILLVAFLTRSRPELPDTDPPGGSLDRGAALREPSPLNPDPAVAPLSSSPAPAADSPAATQPEAASAPAPATSRAAAARSGPGRTRSSARSGSLPPAAAAAVAGAGGADASEASAAPPEAAVARGSLFSIDTPGLAAPALLEEPEVLHFSPNDPRPAVATSALLDLLVGENGRVLDYRVLRASRPPSGFGPAVSRYVAALRYRPAELRGVPVRVWFHHELRFTAPS